MSFKNECAIITGASRGIGRATALGLAAKGSYISIFDINEQGARQTASLIEDNFGQKVFVKKVDISKQEQVNQAVRETEEKFGNIHLLVNNAAIVNTTPFSEISLDEWQKVLDINLTGAFYCIKAVLPYMIKERKGKIVNVASIAAKVGGGLFGNVSYAVSKAGLVCLTKGVAKEMASYGINVNAIAPSATDTEMIKDFTGPKREAFIQSLPMGRVASPEEMASAIIFLLSDEASYITGEIMDVNGGLYMD
ncbi:MAG: hypothetical protein VR72_17705 [Clostridiaceae bacterium BRH_c20a]|nr:MAG: hypothetical protein VR72_17705 [Clostridiaceae bacterium BRH_c20a]